MGVRRGLHERWLLCMRGKMILLWDSLRRLMCLGGWKVWLRWLQLMRW